MRIRRFVVLCSALVASLPAWAAAQETHKAGITIGFPAAVGILWHVNNKVAIRPEVSFAGTTSDTTNPQFETDSSSWNVGFGLSALFYMAEHEHLRTYFTPRFTYGHTSATSRSTNPLATNLESTTTVNSPGASGSFGAQYALGDRFSLFGELGFAYSHASTTSTLTTTKSSGDAWGIRSGVGVVFYP